MEPLTAAALLAAVAALVLFLLRQEGSDLPRGGAAPGPRRAGGPTIAGGPAPTNSGPGIPLPLPERDLGRSDRLRRRLRAAETDAWIARRTAAWKARRRWFADPAWRDRQLARLCPHGGAPATPPEGKLLALHQWLEFLAESLEAVDDPELRPRVAALYGPWRGFVLDVGRFVERQRRGLTDIESAQLPPPAWLEPLRRLDGRLFHGVPYDFLEQPLDRSLLEADGARRKPPEADAVASAPDER